MPSSVVTGDSLARTQTLGRGMWTPIWLAMDAVRRMREMPSKLSGSGRSNAPYKVLASDTGWRLRQYSGGDAHSSLLIVAAPIKQPYIWDLAPGVSVVRHCLSRGLRVYLLEWAPPSRGDRNSGPKIVSWLHAHT